MSARRSRACVAEQNSMGKEKEQEKEEKNREEGKYLKGKTVERR